jgi:hypothetical protein
MGLSCWSEDQTAGRTLPCFLAKMFLKLSSQNKNDPVVLVRMNISYSAGIIFGCVNRQIAEGTILKYPVALQRFYWFAGCVCACGGGGFTDA